MARAFYPFVEDADGERAGDGTPGPTGSSDPTSVEDIQYPARIAVYDDPSVAPRVVVVEPKDVRSYLEEITLTVNKLSHEQGGTIPFMIIREIVENFIHAYFIEPTISILDDGNTIRFSDQGPGIKEKELAMEFGTSSATEEMKQYIRGVGGGFPTVQQYMLDKGGSLLVQDNVSNGTVVTISTRPARLSSNLTAAASRPEEGSHPVPETRANPFLHMDVDDRGRSILDYLSTHDAVGPSDLTREFGESQPTWSRELKALDEKGLLKKEGQKRHLTEVGRAYLSSSSQ